MKDKLMHGVVPAVLLTLAVGSIYAFSIFVQPIAAATGWSDPKTVQFAFSLGIFFLGMGAAFFGPIVEKNIRLATVIGTAMFVAGFVLTQLAVDFKSLWLLYFGYGCVVGTATGIIYISPVKTLMLWFDRHPGIASAVSIVSFGFGASLCSLLYKQAVLKLNLESHAFFVLAAVYAAMMLPGILLLKKPKTALAAKAASNEKLDRVKLLKEDHFVRKAWTFMFLNISAGLALIGCAASILAEYGYSRDAAIAVVALMGISNTLGRFAFAAVADWLKERRAFVWIVIPILSIVSILPAIAFPCAIVLPLILIPALYGAGFSTCPSILSTHYGMGKISTIHGLVLSAWGFAGLVGNQLSELIKSLFGSYHPVLTVLVAIYALVLLNSCRMLRK